MGGLGSWGLGSGGLGLGGLGFGWVVEDGLNKNFLISPGIVSRITKQVNVWLQLGVYTYSQLRLEWYDI